MTRSWDETAKLLAKSDEFGQPESMLMFCRRCAAPVLFRAIYLCGRDADNKFDATAVGAITGQHIALMELHDQANDIQS